MLTIVLCCLLKTYHFASRVTHSCHRVAASTFDQNLSDSAFPRQKFDGGDSEPVLFFGSEIKPTNPVNPLSCLCTHLDEKVVKVGSWIGSFGTFAQL